MAEAPGRTPGTDSATGTATPPRASPPDITQRHVEPTCSVDHVVADSASRLANPGLVVLTGLPGAGLTTALRLIAAAFRGPVFTGGGLAILRTTPGLALTRAVRARLPVDDQALFTEAVRSRVRGGLLVVDDLQWADSLTVAALPELASHCRVVVALRTPHPLPAAAVRRLESAARGWFPVPPLTGDAATALVRRTAPNLGPATVATVVRRAGGIPLALESLARHAAHQRDTTRPDPSPHGDIEPHIGYAVAEALADLTRPARTAMAALGLLGRPAGRGLLGPGVDELAAAALVDEVDGTVTARSPYVAEVAAGMLDAGERPALHRRLAELVPPGEAARHLAAAGEPGEAYRRAVTAAGSATTAGERADLLLLACGLDDVQPDHEVVTSCAEAALAAGRPRSCLRVLDRASGDTPASHAAVLRAEALLQSGRTAAAQHHAATVPDTAPADIVAARDRIRLLAALGQADGDSDTIAQTVAARHGATPRHSGLRAALAGAAAADRTSGWETGLATAAAAAGATGDSLAARWSAWLLVETLAADGRLGEAITAAQRAAEACGADLAYSWQTRFLAAELWCTALRGDGLDAVARRAVDLIDRTVPAVARGYAMAAASLAEADGGLLAASRVRLAHASGPPSVAALLDWVAGEAAWLDGQPERAGAPTAEGTRLVRGLHEITTRWAAHDGAPATGAGVCDHTLTPVRATLAAWRAVLTAPGRADEFRPAAESWHSVVRREEIRCLLALGMHAATAADAVPPLLEAERLAEEAGLVVLLGRVRRALRRHGVRREIRGPRAGDDLTGRETDVLRLVAQGEPTRRIAGLLGISRETVETHIRSGMRKLGARTRTEAAARAVEVLG